MKLIKQKGRDYGDKEYYKYLIVVPNKVIKELGWKGGEHLEVEVKANKLMIEKD